MGFRKLWGNLYYLIGLINFTFYTRYEVHFWFFRKYLRNTKNKLVAVFGRLLCLYLIKNLIGLSGYVLMNIFTDNYYRRSKHFINNIYKNKTEHFIFLFMPY